MSWILRTLTPIYIGEGESYNQLGYLLEGSGSSRFLHRISFEALENALGEEGLDDLTRWIERRQENARVDRRSRPNLWEFLRETGRANKARSLCSTSDYAIPLLGRTPSSVNSFVKEGGCVFIPGSTLKGSLRTALLYGLIVSDNDLRSWLKERLRQVVREKGPLHRDVHKIQDELIAKAFRAGGAGDAKYDVLRHAFIPDSVGQDPSSCLYVGDVEVIGSSRGRAFACELLKPGSEFELRGARVVVHGVDEPRKLGYSEKQRAMIGGPGEFLASCHEFYTRVAREDAEYFRSRGEVQLEKKLIRIASQSTPEAPIVRLGGGVGYLSVTVALAVKDVDRKLFEEALAPAAKGWRRLPGFPKTRRVAAAPSGVKEPMGWAQLRVEK